MLLTAEQMNLLAKWDQARKTLELAKQEEAQLRVQVIEGIQPNREIGIHKYQLPNGYEARLKLNETTSISAENDAVRTQVAELIATGGLSAELAARLVKWEPKLSLSEYKKLTAVQQAFIDPLLETKPAAAVVEIITPKAKVS